MEKNLLESDFNRQVEITAQVFRKWIEEKGHQMTPDGRVSESQAADIIGRSPKTLSNFRATGIGPPFFKAGGSIEYRLRDLALWLESSREETVFYDRSKSCGFK